MRSKTGVINDPLGQPTVPVGSDCRLILDGRTLCVKIVITTGRDCGRPRGSSNSLVKEIMDSVNDIAFRKVDINVTKKIQIL